MNKLMEKERYEQSTYDYDVNNSAYFNAEPYESRYSQNYDNGANYQRYDGYYQNNQNYDYRQRDYADSYVGDYRRDYNANYYHNEEYRPMQNVGYAQQQEYSEYYYRDNSEGYVRQNPIMNQNNSGVSKSNSKKKSKLNIKAKMLICVYFFIVAVIATLLIINMATAGTGAVSASVEESVTYNEEAIGYAVDADGNVVEMQPMGDVTQYSYDTKTGGFDSLCDSIAKLLG
ncbi:MAG: hypothetical protein ACI4MI_01050 [Christensenellales bacterium]